MSANRPSPQLRRTVKVLPKKPSIRPERALSAMLGGGWVAGVDEAGRGPLAGPVVAAAVIFDPEARRPTGLRDSKKLSPARRSLLARQIRRTAIASAVGIASPEEIDSLNILEATRLAAVRAIRQLVPEPIGLITDALTFPGLILPTAPLVKGDCRSASVAAASILAKTHRDALMDAYADEFPEYNWRSNRGYPTLDHLEALERYGPTSLHRLSFRGVGFFTTEPRRSQTYYRLRAILDEALAGAEELALCFPRLRAGVQEASHRMPASDIAALHRACRLPIFGEGE